MSNCDKCKKRTSRDDADLITCAGKDCGHIYHLFCVNLKISDVEFMKKEKKQWFCEYCVVKRRSDQYLGVLPASPRPIIANPPIQSTKAVSNISLDIFYNEFVNFKNSLTSDINTLASRLDVIENILATKIDDLKLENTRLKTELCLVQEKANYLEQSQLQNCVEFHGVPEIARDKISDTALNLINNGIGFSYNSSIFDYCYTRKLNRKQEVVIDHTKTTSHGVDDKNENVGTKSKYVLFVKFVSRDIKDIVLNEYRSKKIELFSDLVDPSTNYQIYLNECLSQYNRALLVAAKVIKKDCKFKYLWSRNGLIMMRKNDGDAMQKIKSLEDLENIKNKFIARECIGSAVANINE